MQITRTVIRSGDRVYLEPGEDHWRGAAPERFMTHTGRQEAEDSGRPVTYGEQVTDAEDDPPACAPSRPRAS
jgi:quercetin dioxygenase-like cupin family protein